MTKTNPGNYFEDFRLGQEIVHATPRTVTEGDMALYVALTGSRFPLPDPSVPPLARVRENLREYFGKAA